jgi:transposase
MAGVDLGHPTGACLEGILWMLRTGARWRDLPEEYPNGSTCWRRLRMWEEQGIWLKAWRKRLGQLDERRRCTWHFELAGMLRKGMVWRGVSQVRWQLRSLQLRPAVIASG